MMLKVKLNGEEAEIELTPEAVEKLRAGLPLSDAETQEQPLTGYRKLSEALKVRGISRDPKTLERYALGKKIPCYRFNGRSWFYLSQVIESMTGKGRFE